jgi:CubicO group peptidase (beta-lactamase class C family)
MVWCSAAFCVLTLCVGRTAAQDNAPPLVSPEAKAVDVLLQKFDRTDAPGVSVGVYRAGEVIYNRAAGMADLEHGLRLTTASVFDIASMSKQFTAMAVVLLQEDGRLALDDEIQKFLPEVHTAGKKVTIGQLLQHTSGIRDFLDLMELAGKSPDNTVVSQADVLDVISAQEHLNFDPGSAYRYENTSYALMATLVQRVSGKSLRQFAAERIFGPLGMSSTQFRDNHTDLIKNRACGYEPRDAGWSGVTPIYDEVGDGGVWTTVEDLAKWDSNFYGPRVGGEEGIKLLLSQATLSSGLKMSYALGLFVEKYRGFAMVSHGGVDPGYRAQMLRFPDERLTVAVLANNPAYDVEGLARQIADIYLPKTNTHERAPSPVPSPTALDWSQLAGTFLDEQTGRTREIVVRDGTLVLRSRGREFPLSHLGGQRFEDRDGTLFTFEANALGNVQMTMSANGQMPSVSRKLPAKAPAWNAEQYKGVYTSSELGVAWRIESQGPDLSLVRGDEKIPISAIDRDEFVSELGLIRFIRVGDGRVTALTVTDVRDIGIEFQRLSH